MKPLLLLFLALALLCAGNVSRAQEVQPTAAPDTQSPAASAIDAGDAAATVAPVTAPMALIATTPAAATAAPSYDHGDVAWVLTATLLVILMTLPGLALFYGGLARAKNMLSILLQVFVVFALVTLLWCIYGYSLTFSDGGRFFGGFDKMLLRGITPHTLSGGLPEYAYVAFQATFAAIACALIVGAYAERIRFAAVLLFSALWFTFSYIPIAHMVWAASGLLSRAGTLDFAGGTVVHINAGVAGLCIAWLIGKRIGHGREAMPPHSLTLTMVGAALLWVGWFGFNAGSALAADGTAALAFINTIVATSAATLSWLGGEALIKGKASMLGAASGAVAGLVAVTPAAGFVGPMGAIVLGLIAGVACLWGVTGLKRRLRIDDAFDVFGVHGVGGIVGALLTGLFAAPWLGGTQGADYALGLQLWVQLKSVLITIGWSALVTLAAAKIADMLLGLRVSEEDERTGLDTTAHGESAYAP